MNFPVDWGANFFWAHYFLNSRNETLSMVRKCRNHVKPSLLGRSDIEHLVWLILQSPQIIDHKMSIENIILVKIVDYNIANASGSMAEMFNFQRVIAKLRIYSKARKNQIFCWSPSFYTVCSTMSEVQPYKAKKPWHFKHWGTSKITE